MAVTLAQLQTYLSTAATNIAGGNYATALTNYHAAQAILAGLPDAAKANASMNFGTMARVIADGIKECHKQIAESRMSTAGGAGLQRTKITFKRTTS